jgi:hypothetical protein
VSGVIFSGSVRLGYRIWRPDTNRLKQYVPAKSAERQTIEIDVMTACSPVGSDIRGADFEPTTAAARFSL